MEKIKMAVAKNDNFLLAMGVGNIKGLSNTGDKNIDYNIKNVLYVTHLGRNILSVKKLEQSGVKYENLELKLIKNKNFIGLGKRENLYKISWLEGVNECWNMLNLFLFMAQKVLAYWLYRFKRYIEEPNSEWTGKCQS